MSTWHFNADYRGGTAERLFGDIDTVFALEGEAITKDPLSRVLRVTADSKRYYVKRYVGNGKNIVRRWFGLRGLLGPQRVRKEWENLLAFRAWGIPTATLVGYGLQRRFGSFVRGALITEEIPDTADLANMAYNNDPRLRDRRWVAHVLRQVAAITRKLHNAGFAHNDLKWRNLLVDGGELATVHLIDCPSGGYWWGVFLQYRMIKDLACLDKVGKYQLSRSQRLRFYLDYAGHRRLTAKDKQDIRKILKFFAGRE
jgi:hypothetical protein